MNRQIADALQRIEEMPNKYLSPEERKRRAVPCATKSIFLTGLEDDCYSADMEEKVRKWLNEQSIEGIDASVEVQGQNTQDPKDSPDKYKYPEQPSIIVSLTAREESPEIAEKIVQVSIALAEELGFTIYYSHARKKLKPYIPKDLIDKDAQYYVDHHARHVYQEVWGCYQEYQHQKANVEYALQRIQTRDFGDPEDKEIQSIAVSHARNLQSCLQSLNVMIYQARRTLFASINIKHAGGATPTIRTFTKPLPQEPNADQPDTLPLSVIAVIRGITQSTLVHEWPKAIISALGAHVDYAVEQRTAALTSREAAVEQQAEALAQREQALAKQWEDAQAWQAEAIPKINQLIANAEQANATLRSNAESTTGQARLEAAQRAREQAISQRDALRHIQEQGAEIHLRQEQPGELVVAPEIQDEWDEIWSHVNKRIQHCYKTYEKQSAGDFLDALVREVSQGINNKSNPNSSAIGLAMGGAMGKQSGEKIDYLVFLEHLAKEESNGQLTKLTGNVKLTFVQAYPQSFGSLHVEEDGFLACISPENIVISRMDLTPGAGLPAVTKKKILQLIALHRALQQGLKENGLSEAVKQAMRDDKYHDLINNIARTIMEEAPAEYSAIAKKQILNIQPIFGHMLGKIDAFPLGKHYQTHAQRVAAMQDLVSAIEVIEAKKNDLLAMAETMPIADILNKKITTSFTKGDFKGIAAFFREELPLFLASVLPLAKSNTITMKDWIAVIKAIRSSQLDVYFGKRCYSHYIEGDDNSLHFFTPHSTDANALVSGNYVTDRQDRGREAFKRKIQVLTILINKALVKNAGKNNGAYPKVILTVGRTTVEGKTHCLAHIGDCYPEAIYCSSRPNKNIFMPWLQNAIIHAYPQKYAANGSSDGHKDLRFCYEDGNNTIYFEVQAILQEDMGVYNPSTIIALQVGNINWSAAPDYIEPEKQLEFVKMVSADIQSITPKIELLPDVADKD